MTIQELVEKVIRRPTERKLCAKIRDDHILNGAERPRKFEAGRAYFEIRLSEMFLRDQREYWKGYVPLAVTLSEFLYAGEQKTVPFLVGNQLLKQAQNSLDGENVQYRNTTIAGPIPYNGGNVSLFVGLFRSQVSDFSDRLWRIVEEVVKAFDVSQLSRYLQIAAPLQAGLEQLFGMKEIEFRVGERNEFTETDESNNCLSFAEGYFAYVNCSDTALRPEILWVKDGSLFVGSTQAQMQPLRNFDYCLIRLGKLTQRNDYTKFRFHRLWEDAQREIYKCTAETRARASKLLLELSSEVAASPDIIQEQRYQLIRMYKANFERDVATADGLPEKSPATEHEATRSAKVENSACSALDHTALMAHEAGAKPQAVKALKELSQNWDKIPVAKDKRVTEELIARQLSALGSFSAETTCDPAALSDALALAALRSER